MIQDPPHSLLGVAWGCFRQTRKFTKVSSDSKLKYSQHARSDERHNLPRQHSANIYFVLISKNSRRHKKNTESDNKLDWDKR